jgi:NAD(P)-dependent dehydrogenase (short-subunit alcohol dehydrogenase family)
MSVNLDGVFLGTKYAIRTMRESGGGSIVNISSMAGIVGMQASTSPYVASKGAVRLFTKSTALECSKAGRNYNIRANSVHPGFILTEMLQGIIQAEAKSKGTKYEESLKIREERAPIGQLGTPEDVAYAVLYLASDESKYMTGSEIVVDGGVTAQ